jgi:hypothetical protein
VRSIEPPNTARDSTTDGFSTERSRNPIKHSRNAPDEICAGRVAAGDERQPVHLTAPDESGRDAAS